MPHPTNDTPDPNAPPEGLTEGERILWLASLGALQGPYSVETASDGTMSWITAPDAVDAAEREIVADFLYRGCARYFSLLEPGDVRGMLSEVARMRTATDVAKLALWSAPCRCDPHPSPDLRCARCKALAALARPAEGEEKV